MKKAFIMYCPDGGECELWFDEKDKLLGGYFCNDAEWRGEYFDGLMENLGVKVEKKKFNAKLAKKAKKELWGL